MKGARCHPGTPDARSIIADATLFARRERCAHRPLSLTLSTDMWRPEELTLGGAHGRRMSHSLKLCHSRMVALVIVALVGVLTAVAIGGASWADAGVSRAAASPPAEAPTAWVGTRAPGTWVGTHVPGSGVGSRVPGSSVGTRAPSGPVMRPPVSPITVVTPARIPRKPWLSGHRGVDLAVSPDGVIVSPRAGVVTFAGVVVDRPVLTVTHGDGWKSSFESVDALVEVGTHVATGEPIARLSADSPHCPGTTCVHWGVRHHGTYVDPLDVLAGFGPVRLLAVDG